MAGSPAALFLEIPLVVFFCTIERLRGFDLGDDLSPRATGRGQRVARCDGGFRLLG